MKAKNIILTAIHLCLCAFYVWLWIYLNPSLYPSVAFVRDIVLFVFALHALAAVLAHRGIKAGRTVSKVLGTILLLGVPIGTIVGAAILSQTSGRWETADDNAQRPQEG